MSADEIAETVESLRRALPLVRTGQMSELAGCRIEGAIRALSSIGGDVGSPFARSGIADTIRRLTARRSEGGMTLATAHRIEGALLALQSLAGRPSVPTRPTHPASEAPAPAGEELGRCSA